MTLIELADSVRDFLMEHVTPEIRLKAPAENDVHGFKLIEPTVNSVYAPRQDQTYAHAGPPAPSILVIPVEGRDEANKGSAEIQLHIVVWDHAHQTPGIALSHTEGWRDLANLIDLTRRKLELHAGFGAARLEYPIEFGYLLNEDMPEIPGFFFGWVKFRVNYALSGRRVYDDLL